MEKYWVPVLLALILSVGIAVYYQYPIGADVNFHIKTASYWANGNFTYLLRHGQSVYPPLLHLIMVPSVWLNIPVPFALAMQVALLPLAVYAITKIFKGNSALLIGLVVLGSMAYVDRTYQVNPQALDFILFPLAIYFSQIKPNNKGFIAASTLMFWNHSFVALACLGGVFIQMLYKKQWKPIVWIMVFSSPIIIASLIYFPVVFNSYRLGVFENAQERIFWSTPLQWTVIYQRLPFFGFFALAYTIINRKLTQLDTTCLLTLASLTLLVVPWADRFIQYTTIPLSIALVSAIQKTENKTGGYKWLNISAKLAVYIMFIFSYAIFWFLLYINGYHVVK